mmetsp:Transcript_1389/g.2608  ORF Transcript_1389/g.2608 Transcript_1389/m.2608 type:complete len:98 (+) Transcript_1389:737-1030(+)
MKSANCPATRNTSKEAGANLTQHGKNECKEYLVVVTPSATASPAAMDLANSAREIGDVIALEFPVGGLKDEFIGVECVDPSDTRLNSLIVGEHSSTL